MKWGPEPLGGGKWRFNLWAPGVAGVELELAPPPFQEGAGGGAQPSGLDAREDAFERASPRRGGSPVTHPQPLSSRDGRTVSMSRSSDGWYSIEAAAEPGSRYRFRVSPELAIPDPASRAQAEDVHGWSLLIDPDGYRWQKEWRGRPWEEAVVYELHAGLLGGFRGVADRLPELAELGVTAVELMPVAAFSGTRNWGYDGVLPYAPASAYGTPEELKALVDRAHGLGLMVLLDVVYNHFGPDGNYVHSYAADFFHPEVHTPWGAAIAFDREPVRRFFIDNARMWLEEYRLDGLRFDAVHAIGDQSFLDEMAAELRAATEGRHVHLVLENEANDAARLERGYDAQWNDDFHNVVHVMLTGESEGYYEAFAQRPAEKLARCLAEGFAYQGEKGRGSPSGHLRTTAFVPFLQNHDQVGNRAMGERLIRLTGEERLHAATALLLLMPQVPLLFMGEEVGSQSPFLFFTDFRDELADAVREGRRKEFAKFRAFADAEARAGIKDPNDPATFERSRPEPGDDAAEWRGFYRELLALRRQEVVPRLTGARGEGAQVVSDSAVQARWRMGDGSRFTIFVDLGADPATHDGPGTPIFAIPGFSAWLEAA
jgi:maltooligosyltrehalose trehalohydrolase